ncbi:MAG: hypothetical protein R6U17_00260 [Thermoplasmata archaeon]
MIEDTVEHGLPEPEFKDTGTAIVVTFRKMIIEESLREKGLNERQIEAVKYVKKEGNIKNKIYRDFFDVSKRTATSDLTELVEMGILKKEGKGRGTEYVLP